MKKEINREEVYRIPAGESSSTPVVELRESVRGRIESLEVSGFFSESCTYNPEVEPVGPNILVGLSFDYSHRNSVSIAWRYNLEERCIDIYGYWYEGSILKKHYLSSLHYIIEENGLIKVEKCKFSLLIVIEKKRVIIIDRINKEKLNIEYRFPKRTLEYLLTPSFREVTLLHDLYIFMDIEAYTNRNPLRLVADKIRNIFK